MKSIVLPGTRRSWDLAFALLLPVATVAAGIGILFGGPVDNVIVAAWLLPVWLIARMSAPAEQQYA